MSWTTWEDVDDAYNEEIREDQIDWITYLVDAAERALLREPATRRIPNWIEDGKLDVQHVKDAVAFAVLRMVRNPEGASLEVEGNYTIQVRADVAGGLLFFTTREIARLKPLPSNKPGGPIRSTIPCYRSRP